MLRKLDPSPGSSRSLSSGRASRRPVGSEPPSPASGEGTEYAAPPRLILPPHAPGMRIGLFGGTFDPPHEAHLSASLLAMKRLDLDRPWWLVTPGNPLKDTRGLAPLAQRIVAAGALARHPRIDISSLEAQIGTTYT